MTNTFLKKPGSGLIDWPLQSKELLSCSMY